MLERTVRTQKGNRGVLSAGCDCCNDERTAAVSACVEPGKKQGNRNLSKTETSWEENEDQREWRGVRNSAVENSQGAFDRHSTTEELKDIYISLASMDHGHDT